MPKAKPTAQDFTKRGTLVKLPAKKEGKVVTRVVVDHWPAETDEFPECIIVANKKHAELVKSGRVLGYVIEAKTLLLRPEESAKPIEPKAKKKRGRKKKEEASTPKKKAKNGRRKK